ncbi:MAG: UTRA domain-containing protein [Alphaproteobacteria bacterium]
MSVQEGARFRDVKARLLARVRERIYAPGARIPGEAELAEEFGCARATVSRALRELAEAGVVERRRKAGTRVVAEPVREATVTVPLVRAQIEARGQAYRYALLDRRIAMPGAGARARLELPPGRKALHVRCLHFADGAPWQYEDRWINLEAAPRARRESFAGISPNEWLVRELPFSDAEHVFHALNAGEAEADFLGVRPGDALFAVERRTRLDGRVITWVRLLHPGASFRMVSRGPIA